MISPVLNINLEPHIKINRCVEAAVVVANGEKGYMHKWELIYQQLKIEQCQK